VLYLLVTYELRLPQREGIEIAKKKGLYRGRKVGTKEPKEKILKKDRNQKILSYLNEGYRYSEICKIVGCSYSTINKVKRINAEFQIETI